MHSETVLGIDFGTTNSVCAVLSGGDPEVLENADGNRTTPSVVYYTKEDEQNRPLVGQAAENKAQDNPERVIHSIKREMGDQEFIEVDGDQYRVEEIAADIIRKIRTDAAEKLSVDRDELTKAVITTPAYWESDRNQAVIQAAELAGFDSVRTIREPAAAAIAYGRFEPGLNKTVGVYDLGGGTFDFAIVDVKVGRDENEGSEYDVKAQSGDPQLGGDDWDDRIVDWLASNFEQETGVDPLEPHHSDTGPYTHLVREERLRAKARSAKEKLSNRANTEVNIRIPFLMDISGKSVDIDTTLTQTQFESMTEDLLEATVDPIHTAVDDAKEAISDFDSIHDIDDVILVGGSTRMPQVNELVKSVFQKEPKQRVNPDEAVAAGAAIKANRDDILLLEVTPLSLGIGIRGDRFKRMIHRNERLPARTTEVFTTANEGATAVRIPIYQGERDIGSENRHLKTLIIQGMAPGSRHSAHIEVTFEVQQNGLINVQAVENTRNKSVGVEIEGENRLPDEYIQRKVDEAREMEEMDRRRQKVIDAQNDARKALKDAERLLNEFPHVFEGEEAEHMKKHVANVREVRKDNTATLGELREATENLNEWVLEIGDRIRRSGARNQSGPTPGPDTDPADIDSTATSDGVRTPAPGQTVTSDDQPDESATSTDDLGEVGAETGPDSGTVVGEEGTVPDDENVHVPEDPDMGSLDTGDSMSTESAATFETDSENSSEGSETSSEQDTSSEESVENSETIPESESVSDSGSGEEGQDNESSGNDEIITPDDDEYDDDLARPEQTEEEVVDETVGRMDDDNEDPIGDSISDGWENVSADEDEEFTGENSFNANSDTDTETDSAGENSPGTDTSDEESTSVEGGEGESSGDAESNHGEQLDDEEMSEETSSSGSDSKQSEETDRPVLGDSDPEELEPDVQRENEGKDDEDQDEDPSEQSSFDIGFN